MQQIDYIPKLPPRPKLSHKGTFGTVIVVGGCDTMFGAPALCARAALRTGAGLVKVACSAAILPHIITIEPSVTGIVLSQDPAEAMDQINHADPRQKAVLAVGPGMGISEANGELIAMMLRGRRPIVLDADGLSLFAQQLDADNDPGDYNAPLVLTPHPGEYMRLAEPLGINADPVKPTMRVEATAIMAKRLQSVVLLKGHRTVIVEKARFSINPTGNPALAVPGSGDVLTGIIASLTAQGMDCFNAAVLGSYAHGLAGDRWAKVNGKRGLRAIELTNWLPQVFTRLAKE
ncbi:MAG: NAD(P)H-hydrate dehydratase [Phycisphaeraceae bacterium]